MTVEQFFTHYAALSMGDDDRALAAVYAPSFFVAGPTGSMTFANDAQFLDWLAQVRTFNREHGMRALSPAAVRETLLSPLHVLAQVRWSARFEKTGTRAIEFEIAYLMELAGESWRCLGTFQRAIRRRKCGRWVCCRVPGPEQRAPWLPPGLPQLGRLHHGLLVQQYRQHFHTSHKNNAAVPRVCTSAQSGRGGGHTLKGWL